MTGAPGLLVSASTSKKGSNFLQAKEDRSMGIFETNEHTQATKQGGKDQHLTPSPTEAKDAQVYFDEIIKKEKQNSTLPNLSFKTVARGDVYVLQESSKDPNSHITSTKELGLFQEYTNGYKSATARDYSPDGKTLLRETEDITTTTSHSTKVFEPIGDDQGPHALKEKSEKFSNLKDGKEISTVDVNFEYSDSTKKANHETIVACNADGSGLNQVFTGNGQDKLKLQSEVDTGADGKEVQRVTFEDIQNDQKQVVGRRETIVAHNKGNVTTSTFEGPQDDQMKAVGQVIAYDNGKTQTFKPNAKGELVLVKTP
jgi:hypothetical protein